MRVPRELLLLVAILLFLALATSWAQPAAVQPDLPGLSSLSPAPEGTLALYLWLEELGYRVERLAYRDFAPPAKNDTLLIMAPTVRPAEGELVALRRWVEGGGTLVLVGDYAADTKDAPFGRLLASNTLPAFLKELDLSAHRFAAPQDEVKPAQPLLLNPPVRQVKAKAEGYVTGPPSLAPYLGALDRPVAAGMMLGAGRVYVLLSGHALSNRGLAEADNAALLLNWLPLPKEAATIVFDEVHHGLGEERSLMRLMVREPWGWAVFYAVGMTFLYLLLSGRRFGRATPSVVDGRRAAAEYVVSLAGLLRRGKKQDWVARHYERALRRQLAASFDLDPALDPEAVAARLSRLGPAAGGVDGTRVGRLLANLGEASGGTPNERKLVQLVAETDAIITACSGRRR